jgi:hypothetical protein
MFPDSRRSDVDRELYDAVKGLTVEFPHLLKAVGGLAEDIAHNERTRRGSNGKDSGLVGQTGANTTAIASLEGRVAALEAGRGMAVVGSSTIEQERTKQALLQTRKEWIAALVMVLTLVLSIVNMIGGMAP